MSTTKIVTDLSVSDLIKKTILVLVTSTSPIRIITYSIRGSPEKLIAVIKLQNNNYNI